MECADCREIIKNAIGALRAMEKSVEWSHCPSCLTEEGHGIVMLDDDETEAVIGLMGKPPQAMIRFIENRTARAYNIGIAFGRKYKKGLGDGNSTA